jgi:hypothetical protein
MDFRKISIVVALVVVIAVVAVLTVKRTSGTGESKMLNEARRAQAGAIMDKIDNKSLEIISEPASDWMGKYAPDSSGHFKNPKTGEYTMVTIITCASCGAQIPAPDLNPALKGKATVRTDRAQAMHDQLQILHNYQCPKCGKNAYSLQSD